MTRTFPSNLPRWSETAGDSGTQTGIVAPSSGKQDVGWAKGERPANEFMNWFMNLTYEALRFVQAVINPLGFSSEAVADWRVTNTIVLGSDLTVGRDATVGGSLFLDGEQLLTPGGSTQNNVALADHRSYLRLTGNGIPYTDITGFAGGVDGRVVVVVNVGTNQISFEHQNAGSVAANRMILPGSTAMTMSNQNDVFIMRYDGADSRWRVISKTF